MKSFITGSTAAGVLACVIFGFIAFSGEPVIAPDTPFYLSIAEGLRSHPAEVFLSTDRVRWTVLTLPVLLVVAREVAPDRWPYIIVVINVLCMAIAAALLIATVRIVTPSSLAVIAALLFWLTSYDVIAWLRWILTDNLFTAAALATYALVIRGIVLDGPMRRRRLQVALALFLGFITRANGAIVIPVVIFAEWWSHREPPRRWVGKFAPWIVVFVLAMAGMLGRAYFFTDLNRWPTDFLRPALEKYAEREKTGQVVWDRDESTRTPPHTTFDHFVLQGDRFVRFFQFRTAGFSRMHNLVNTAYYIPLYLLALLGFAQGLRSNDRRRRAVVVVTALWILSTAWLHAITILDFDWRYRLPVLPMIILLAACGVEVVSRRLVHRAAGSEAMPVAS